MKKDFLIITTLLLVAAAATLGFKPLVKAVMHNIEQERLETGERNDLNQYPAPKVLESGRLYCTTAGDCVLLRS